MSDSSENNPADSPLDALFGKPWTAEELHRAAYPDRTPNESHVPELGDVKGEDLPRCIEVPATGDVLGMIQKLKQRNQVPRICPHCGKVILPPGD